MNKEQTKQEPKVLTRVAILTSDLEVLGFDENAKTSEIRQKVRDTLKLPKIRKNTQKARALEKLNLPADATQKDIIEAINKKE